MPATSRRRLWTDKGAGWLVVGGGLAIIASILGILLFIIAEVLPMTRSARVAEGSGIDLDVRPGAVVSDEHRSHVAMLTSEGRLQVVRLADGATVLDRSIFPGDDPAPGLVDVRGAPGQQLLAGATDDGRVVAVEVGWSVSFVGDQRMVRPEIGDPIFFEIDSESRPLGPFSVRVDEDGAATAVAQLTDGSMALVRRTVEENLFTEEITESWERTEFAGKGSLSVVLLDQDQRNVYGGTSAGELIWWTVSDGTPDEPEIEVAGDSPVTAMSLLIGDRSIVTGHEDGTTAIWFLVRQPDESFRLTRIRDFPAHPGAIRLLAPSLRDKGFLAQDSSGRLGLYYSTSHRVLWTGDSPVPEASALFYTPKADGAFVAGPGRLASLEIHNRHPEISFKALFGRVWYEGYEKPEFIWQSTGGTDDFEPKLSLMPLMIGTLKGTLYSLLLAIPLGVLGAMYTSQFMHPRLKRVVKPTVEIMAALPSVVLGFLAGLWLAPRVEKIIPALALMAVALPLLILAAGYTWNALPRALRNRFIAGSESLIYMVVIGLGIWACMALNQWVEAAAFGGDFQAWLLDGTGLRYDQRNAVVVGLAMGFAVIPIIFSIAEDAFSNVPQNLVSGSLALGANRWQTVTRVVLPTASPGIFSGIMIGFGRAVGETMIVLMATGNTPIMDWNPFNGFRTLSANIAVEIPEAPQGATLYGTLFLAALLLFVLTFLLNTAAEIVRQRLRRRYAEL
jgi:phosphate transport system permease protein